GERVTVFATEEGWAHAQLADDGYVGYLPAGALREAGGPPPPKGEARRPPGVPRPPPHLPPPRGPPLGSPLLGPRAQGATAAGGSGRARHLASIDAMEPDLVAVAERFLGAPYLWGGKTSLGLDCSGLVQVALTACGAPCPRDSHMQEAAVGAALPLDLGKL